MQRPPRWFGVRPNTAMIICKLVILRPLSDEIVKLDNVGVLAKREA